MSAFVTVKNHTFECEINRSRFIGICCRVRDDDAAMRALTDIRKTYRDCTHVCYAYSTVDGARSSDDGEPSGTAGVPIAECIRSAGVKEVLVAVVRYFGGIKLGTGGLLRAYTAAASGVIAGAAKTEVCDCDIYKVSYDYAVWKKIEKRSMQSLYKIAGLEYNKTVDAEYAVRSGPAFESELTALTQGKAVAEYLGVRRVERDMNI